MVFAKIQSGSAVEYLYDGLAIIGISNYEIWCQVELSLPIVRVIYDGLTGGRKDARNE